MIDGKKLEELDIEVDKIIFDLEQKTLAEKNAYFEGMRKGASLMYSRIRNELLKEWSSNNV